ncbi:hypothetical protein FAVG1_13084 [Fusarium avenaceum]|nr:hypothetical protein FAVG1_13084 [Fusarium avenaceum]
MDQTISSKAKRKSTETAANLALQPPPRPLSLAEPVDRDAGIKADYISLLERQLLAAEQTLQDERVGLANIRSQKSIGVAKLAAFNDDALRKSITDAETALADAEKKLEPHLIMRHELNGIRDRHADIPGYMGVAESSCLEAIAEAEIGRNEAKRALVAARNERIRAQQEKGHLEAAVLQCETDEKLQTRQIEEAVLKVSSHKFALRVAVLGPMGIGELGSGNMDTLLGIVGE